MELYCKELETYLDMADATFTIEANNQFQDLEGYTVANSYDIKLINNKVNHQIVTNQPYTWTNEKGNTSVYTDYTILLMHNNAPLLTGRLVLMGTEPDTLTCVYQAVPYGRTFKNFIFRENLKDYFKHNDYMYASTVGQVLGKAIGEKDKGTYSATLTAKWQDQSDFDIDDPLNTDIRIPRASIYRLNSTSNDYRDTKHDSKNNWCTTASHLYMYQNNWILNSTVLKETFTPTLCQVKLNELLDCMGIGTNAFADNLWLTFPSKIKFERRFKMTLGVVNRCYTGFQGSAFMCIYAQLGKPIQVWNEEKQEWFDYGVGFDGGPMFFSGPFEYSLARGIAYKDMKLVEIRQPRIDGIRTLQLESGRLQQTSAFIALESKSNAWKAIGDGYAYDGMTYSDGGQQFAFALPYNRLEDVVLLPNEIEVVFDLPYEISMEEYHSMSNGWAEKNGCTPVISTDFTFFEDLKTGDFLNWLSLNVESMKYLRNPLFIAPENADDVWGQEGTTLYDWLDDSNIISMKKTIERDAPSNLRITLPINFKSSCTKHLNDYGNDEKNFEQMVDSCAYTTDFSTMLNIGRYSTPPFMYNSDKEVKERALYGDIKGVVGYWNDDYMVDGRGTQWKVHVFVADSTNYDYLDEYQDHSEYYTVKCTGYRLHNRIKINDVKYSVMSYKTEDFVTFELKLLRIKTDN